MKVFNYNKMVECDEDDASWKIIPPANEDGSIPPPQFYKPAVERQVKTIVMTIDNMDVIEWSPKVMIDSQAEKDDYIVLIDKWYDLASQSELYATFINNTYGFSHEFISEIEKSLMWLKVNNDNRKKNLNAYLTGWLDRWKKRKGV